MPDLDVSDILFDPDFCDYRLTCRRGKQSVGTNGLALNIQTEIPFAGVVTSVSGNNLRRTPEGEFVYGDILVCTTFPLTEGKLGFTADIIEWNERTYTVVSVQDYSRYGAGFVEARCDLIPLSG